MNLNTMESTSRVATVLMEKCSATEKDMEKRLRLAGCPKTIAKETVTLPKPLGQHEDVVYVGLNGVDFYFLRGQTLELATPLVEILRHAGILEKEVRA